MKLQNNEYSPFFKTYISKALKVEMGIVKTLEHSFNQVYKAFSNISDEKQLYAYEKGKWTVKELLSHIIDTERIMAYRALRISRNDTANLLPFNENEFVANSNANEIPYKDLLKEYDLVRKSIIVMFTNFNAELLLRVGTASSLNLSVRAVGFIISGHSLHHLEILKERYL